MSPPPPPRLPSPLPPPLLPLPLTPATRACASSNGNPRACALGSLRPLRDVSADEPWRPLIGHGVRSSAGDAPRGEAPDWAVGPFARLGPWAPLIGRAAPRSRSDVPVSGSAAAAPARSSTRAAGRAAVAGGCGGAPAPPRKQKSGSAQSGGSVPVLASLRWRGGTTTQPEQLSRRLIPTCQSTWRS